MFNIRPRKLPSTPRTAVAARTNKAMRSFIFNVTLEARKDLCGYFPNHDDDDLHVGATEQHHSTNEDGREEWPVRA